MLLHGGAMLLVIVVVLIVGWRVARVGPGWLVVGAIALTLVTFATALLCQWFATPVLQALFQSLPRGAYAVLGGAYTAILQAVCFVGITWLAGHAWWAMSSTAGRALAVCVGGACLTKIMRVVEVVYPYFKLRPALETGQEGAASTATELLLGMPTTPTLVVFGLLDPLLDLCVLTAALLLAFYALAAYRGRAVWFGVLLMSAATLLSSVFSLAGLASVTFSLVNWLYVLPFAVISLVIIRRTIGRWPQESSPAGDADQPEEPAPPEASAASSEPEPDES
jgi:hypothetical protein